MGLGLAKNRLTSSQSRRTQCYSGRARAGRLSTWRYNGGDMANMTKAEFLLGAFMVDNDVGERAATIFRLKIANEHRLHKTALRPTALVSRYRWTLDDAAIIGIPDIDDWAAAKVFVIALTVQSSRSLHSPVIVSTVSLLHVERHGLVGELKTKLTSPPVTIDEEAFVDAAKALSKGWAWKGTRGRIMREAVNSYWDALHSVHRRSRFLELWAAFEKLANIDAKRNLGGASLDAHAARVASAKPADILPLRRLNNWLKHPQEKRPAGADDIGQEARKLKRLLDQCLSGRLSFSLSNTYTP